MATQKITNNAELTSLASSLEPSKILFAIKTKGQIEIFESKRAYNKAAKMFPNAVQGELTAYNFHWYRF